MPSNCLDIFFYKKLASFCGTDLCKKAEKYITLYIMSQPSSEIARPSSEIVRPSSEIVRPFSEIVRPSSEIVRPSSEIVRPSSEIVRPSSEIVRPSSEIVRPSSEIVRAPPAPEAPVSHQPQIKKAPHIKKNKVVSQEVSFLDKTQDFYNQYKKWIIGTIIVAVLVCIGLLCWKIWDNYYRKRTEDDEDDALPDELVPAQEESEGQPKSSEVYNVSNNIYTYHDAKAVCRALGSRMANLEEVKGALKNGGEWCNYGWTDGQLALYPTQRSSWKKLQKGPKNRRNDCGMPGINGGYFMNPDLRFGANCYGIKPESKAGDKGLLGYNPDYITEEEQKLQEKIDQYRKNVDSLTIMPFNRQSWSK
jgi:hypothetical protein